MSRQKTDSAQQKLVTAQAASQSALDAEVQASENVTAAAQLYSSLEAEALRVMAAAARDGDTEESRAKVDDVRARLDKARSDAEWAKLQHEATKLAVDEAHADEARIRQMMVAQEYIDEHAAYNDPNSRENVLLAQLTATMAELIPLILERKQRHNWLTQQFNSWPLDERPHVPNGRSIQYHSESSGHWEHVNFVVAELADAYLQGVNQGLDATLAAPPGMAMAAGGTRRGAAALVWADAPPAGE